MVLDDRLTVIDRLKTTSLALGLHSQCLQILATQRHDDVVIVGHLPTLEDAREALRLARLVVGLHMQQDKELESTL